MKPVGIVSIPLHQVPSASQKFEDLLAAVGNNTGNLLFTNAVWEQINGPKTKVGFNFNAEKINRDLRALVFPAANWFGAHVDFSGLADLVEQLDVPVILIGLGVQDGGYSGTVPVPEGTLRFVRAVAERSRSISVRGAYTRQIMEGYGIRNVRVTGCPSLYPVDTGPSERRLLATAKRKSRPILLHTTRYSARYRPFIETASLHRELFRLALHSQTDLLFQSEPEEISLLVEAAEKPRLDSGLQAALSEIYQEENWLRLERFIKVSGRVFFDLASWRKAMEGYRGLFGTRLHATIMALNSGTPAVLAHHDSRTREVSEFAGLPAVPADSKLADLDVIYRLIDDADIPHFLRQRAINRDIYRAFLSENALDFTKAQPA